MPSHLIRATSTVLSLLLAAGSAWAASLQVAADGVKLRRGPSTTAAVAATLARGEVVQVLENAGDWYRVRTRTGLTGYVSGRWVRPVAADGGPVAGPSPAPTPSLPPPEAAAPAMSVSHKDVGCVVAGRFPRLEACFAPVEAVGRARVLFRADEKGPWFAVELKEGGACRSTLLPKPTKSIERFHYFIEAVDRSFSMVVQPGSAPARSYVPRVVSRSSDCGDGLLAAPADSSGSVFVNLARDAGGKVLEAGTASATGAPTSISGFSMDGVTMPGAVNVARPAPSGGGIGLGVVAIGAGVAAAGVAVAVVAGGGQSSDVTPALVPVAPNQWNSYAVPPDPAPFQDVRVFVTVNRPGIRTRVQVSGTDGYVDDQTLVSGADGTVSIEIPGAEDGVRDTVTASVPEWGSSYTRTWTYVF